ncbi:4Fe-4S dicluster domain-containing protein [bacterium]|nr:4Fe-4S dicluster domain-containing protein [bacterium]
MSQNYCTYPLYRVIIYHMTDRVIPNPEFCTGCLNCLMVCAQHKSGTAHPESAGIRVLLDPFSGVHKILVCYQCVKASCAEACPKNAIYRNDETGAWEIDRSRCICCGTCVQACPFGAMFWNSASEEPVKCDLCGGNPQCILACNFGVLSRG